MKNLNLNKIQKQNQILILVDEGWLSLETSLGGSIQAQNRDSRYHNVYIHPAIVL
jgi:hypothetical protein